MKLTAFLAALLLLGGQTSSFPTAYASLASPDTDIAFTYALTPSRTEFTVDELAESGATVEVPLYITGDPGTAGIQLSFAVDKPLAIASGGYADPYCYGNGTPPSGMGLDYSSDSQMLLWYTTNQGKNEPVYDESLPFCVLTVTLPAGLGPGVYGVSFQPDGCCIADENLVPLSPRLVSSVITVLPDDPNWMLGDVNDDGKIDAADAVCCLRAYSSTLLGKDSPLTPAQRLAADVDKNGVCNSSDAVLILRYYAASLLQDTVHWDALIQQ